MGEIGFEFPEDRSGQWDGFNDPGIEHFAGNLLQHLGREVTQNTIDAKSKSPANIRVRFKKFPVASLPGLSDLKLAIERCVTASELDDSEKAAKFFAEANKILELKYVGVLQIRDSNTTGLIGPCENGKPFFAMLKATGQSRKIGTATGSYGIGKFAPFAVSDLRTVFVSTVWSDASGKRHHYVQGKSVLMSHYDSEQNTRRGTGFWGNKENCSPVEGFPDLLPEWLRITDENGDFGEQGTMISIIGFTTSKGWQNALAANICENFFGAISRGELEVDIDDSVQITQTTLSGLLANDEIAKSIIDQDGEPERFQDAARYLQTLADGDEIIVEKHENYHLGECQLRILIGENLPRRVAVLRNGMLITESLPRLKRFSDFKEFVAVLECPTEKGLHLLRVRPISRHDLASRRTRIMTEAA